MLWKKYFDSGYSITNYLKYFIAFFGLASRNIKWTMIVGFAWAIACVILGRAYLKHRWFEIDIEITNRFNPFVKEMRKSKLLNTPPSSKRARKA